MPVSGILGVCPSFPSPSSGITGLHACSTLIMISALRLSGSTGTCSGSITTSSLFSPVIAFGPASALNTRLNDCPALIAHPPELAHTNSFVSPISVLLR